MGSSSLIFMFLRSLVMLWLFHLIFASLFSFVHPLCHENESSALLHFRESFTINISTSFEPSAACDQQVSSWKLESSGDCCSWGGVECDEDIGHVISLDLSSSCLYGSINSSSSLFRLVHLQRLNLADNDFKDSRIPTDIGQLSRLTYLNLSASVFSGQIPSEILELSKLVSLDLSVNHRLKLQKPGLSHLAEKLTNLKELHLSMVNISSTVPINLANFSSLTSLLLRGCGLHGEFPTGIFHLSNLQSLSLRFNSYLTGNLPEFQSSSPLELLRLAGTSFSGELPVSIRNLKSLQVLDISECNFSGPIPSSLGNLIELIQLDLSSNNLSGAIPSSLGNLTKLIQLDLSSNNFNHGTLSWVGKQTKLTFLGLAEINLYGEISSSFRNLTHLSELRLYRNNLTGYIPSWLANLTHLIELQLQGNRLHGPIPQSISRLVNLETLCLQTNYLIGRVEFDLFHKLKKLSWLQLSKNNLFVLTKPSTNATFPKFRILGLNHCNLSEFPDFLRSQDELEFLELSDNKIQGQLPKWMWNVGKETLLVLHLERNLLTGFNQLPDVLLWANLRVLNLNSNQLQGSLPIPSPSISTYLIANNMFSGEISPMICNLSFVYVLDLSHNNLSGLLPQCLGNLSDSLLVLNLQNNNFHGTIPQTFTGRSQLRMIDFSQNQLQGCIPRSLVSCTMLETLNLGNNQINDTFPSWLGILPELKVLTLRSNRLHGAIRKPKSNFEFPKLLILDLSYNNFIGKLPSEYFKIWKAMQRVVVPGLRYLGTNTTFTSSSEKSFLDSEMLSDKSLNHYDYSMKIINKGIEMTYERILDFFVAINLSNNRFDGEIPEVLGNLKVLNSLNLSNNILIGYIPSSLGKLMQLESLDLSQNELSGEIPSQLTQLTFLESFNVSHNHLTGLIPHEKQFDTFEKSSFDGNSGLCGSQLSKKCGDDKDSLPPPSTFDENHGSESPFEFGWKIVLLGYGCGLVVGVVIGHIVITRKHEWFMKTFKIRQQTRRRVRMRGSRNRM